MIPSQTLPESPSELKFDPKSAIYVPLGAASPFWFLYAGAASAGVAYWWLSRWREATNLEALFATAPAVAALEAPQEPVLEAALVAEPEVEIPQPVVAAEPEPEPAFVAVAELLADPEPLVEAAPAPEPELAAPKPKAPRATRSALDDPA
ncbi:MAG: hypothetical protein Q8Q88_14925 [Phenylobacterium sp.]|uniref:hypothetical protein n=1 Tax=Phenylobacterium sp. TaxID=1871053 RepID=UPI002734DCAA|nr:hypothetical protein [Phenylobacterium sp.]MDP3748330.1 hypothetical protein [Phenylobacterium sp.]